MKILFKTISSIFFIGFFTLSIYSQKNKENIKDESSLYSGLKFRSIGPAFMSGRIADILFIFSIVLNEEIKYSKIIADIIII